MSLPTMLAVGGFATDYASMSGTQNRLQQIVDAAALGIAREMSLSPVTQTRAQNLAVRYAAANIPANTPHKIAITATLIDNNAAVRVEGTQNFSTPFGTFERVIGVSSLSASATARPAGVAEQMKLCVLALQDAKSHGLNLRNGSVLTANGCMLHSNSTSTSSVVLGEGSKLKVQTICTRGGIKNIGSTVEGNLISDCPEIRDPLASKPAPKPALLCKPAVPKMSKGNFTLEPGTYCGGLQIHGTAVVKLNPGVYFFKDGPLRVFNSAELHGDGVTLAFGGQNAYFRFEHDALINLTAPTKGDTAGMLIWEVDVPGVSVGADVAGLSVGVTVGGGKVTSQHRIESDRAKVLTGTIYLKRGILTIDSDKPVADQSPFTIMVVHRLDLYDGPNLVLNSNYQNSPVPVPFGLGPTGSQKLHLEK
ncbi:MAG: pilus assembly protein TadG-related protein [Beijerinckiaceae bacterium]|nr:pilus assembly protein TadG-related protein [Beijerinckiaceae bacterium]MCZ8301569.1 pilus assembly protein TadG-related protein [Beijerinckiaceae bacterium]